MKRLILGGVLGVLAVFMLAPAGAQAAKLSVWVGCGTAPDTPPAETCVLGQKPGAFIKPIDQDIKFFLCFESREMKFNCPVLQVAQAGEVSVSPIPIKGPGRYLVGWFVDGERPKILPLEMVARDAAPGSPQPGPNLACFKASGEVQSLETKLRKAEGKAEAKLRPKLAKAQAKKQRSC